MDAFLRLASGGPSVEEYAKEVHIKAQLTSKINASVRQLHKEYLLDDTYTSTRRSGVPIVLAETSSPAVVDLCNSLEACLLHGLKEKLTLSRVTTAVLGSKNSYDEGQYEIDFWPIVLILCHNQVSESLMKLGNVNTDVGRCRSWIRQTLNDSLFSSYLEALVVDTSLLHGFYRSSAYIRDRDHMDLLRSVLEGLDSLSFQLNYDDSCLNNWSVETLRLIGVNVQEAPDPIMPAVDALDEVRKVELRQQRLKKRNEQKLTKDQRSLSSCTDASTSSLQSSINSISINSERGDNSESSYKTAETASTPTPSKPIEPNPETKLSNAKSAAEQRTPQATTNNEITGPPDIVVSTPTMSTSSRKSETSSVGGNSINRNKGWSSSPPIQVNTSRNRNEFFANQPSYESVLQEYSTEVVLSSTPDLNDFNQSSTFAKLQALKNTTFKSPSARQRFKGLPSTETVTFSGQIADYEVVPKSIVLSYTEPESQEFLMQLCRLGNEQGLNQQDYKCNSCARPIGMIYGRSRLCKFDGFNYCVDCHAEEEMVIPARILFNWDFKKYPVAKRNKTFLSQVESEPLLDIKTSSPSLYKSIPELANCLDLRTQLFYLHAYIFTCAENATLELRRILWPKEHLYEHIHLYSTQDLTQLSSGHLVTAMKKAIAFARRHVLNCHLCSQRGFICEICRDDSIIYPFDTHLNYRCEQCKAVFHKKCVLDETGVRKIPCPRCLRIERREKAMHALEN